MTNEQENSEHPALEDDLFSGASAPVKPLFEQQPQASQPKPLFPADEEPADEAFIEQKLKEAGPTAFVSAPVLPPRPEAAARPSEEDVPSYVPTGRCRRSGTGHCHHGGTRSRRTACGTAPFPAGTGTYRDGSAGREPLCGPSVAVRHLPPEHRSPLRLSRTRHLRFPPPPPLRRHAPPAMERSGSGRRSFPNRSNATSGFFRSTRKRRPSAKSCAMHAIRPD